MAENKKKGTDQEKNNNYITREELDEQANLINSRIDKITDHIDNTKKTIDETNSKIRKFLFSLGKINEDIQRMMRTSKAFNSLNEMRDYNKWKSYFMASLILNILLFILIVIVIYFS